jgi:hypothetical protein
MEISCDTAEFTDLLLWTLEKRLKLSAVRVEIPTESERFTTLNALGGFRNINWPGVGASRDAATGRLIEENEISREGGLTHVIPIDFDLSRA